MSNHYQTLGLPDRASLADIRTAYQQALRRFLLAQQLGSPLPKEDFDALQAAYAALGTPEDKAAYDGQLSGASVFTPESTLKPASESTLKPTPESPGLMTLDASPFSTPEIP
ncbi:MAG: J domain-containing protein, partial [Zoogloeaceae bacterium]|nr:J domain-containing protein [Zoogloeaceae bacterium]